MRIIQCGVYRITNIINGDFYIGSSVDIQARWYKHRYDYNNNRITTRSYLYNAWKKYGEASFKIEIVEEVTEPYDHQRGKSDKDYAKDYAKRVLLPREQHYIDTEQPVYNLAKTAGSRLGIPMSPEHKELLRTINTELWKDPERRERARELSSEIWKDPELRAEAGQRSSKRWQNPEHRAKVSAGHQENWDDPEFRAHRQEIMNDPDTVEKLRQAKLGKPNSDESKAKNSIASQAMWDAHPEYRDIASQRQSDIMTPERREQMRDLRLGKSFVEVFGEERAKEIAIKRVANTDHVARGKAISLGKMGKPRPDKKGKVGPSSVSGEWGVIFRTDTQKFSVQIEGIRYGSFLNKEEAIARRDFVDEALKTNSPIPREPKHARPRKKK